MKKKVEYVVLHPEPLPTDTIVDNIKQYWQKQSKWKNPGVHYIVSSTGKIEELLLEPGNQSKAKRNSSVHFSFVLPDNAKSEALKSSVESQVQSFVNRLWELKAKYPNASTVIEFEVSEN